MAHVDECLFWSAVLWICDWVTKHFHCKFRLVGHVARRTDCRWSSILLQFCHLGGSRGHGRPVNHWQAVSVISSQAHIHWRVGSGRSLPWIFRFGPALNSHSVIFRFDEVCCPHASYSCRREACVCGSCKCIGLCSLALHNGALVSIVRHCPGGPCQQPTEQVV